MKLKPEDIRSIREKSASVSAIRRGEGAAEKKMDLLVCAGTGCVSNHSLKVKASLIAEIEKHELQDRINAVSYTHLRAHET